MALTAFHPAVATWFERTFGEPTPPQVEGWPAIRGGTHTLIASPTGSGKTLAAFLCAIDELVQRGLREGLEDRVSILYLSPLKALSNDIERNLRAPLEGIRGALEELGYDDVGIRTAVRTGDTPSYARTKMVKEPPHIFVTTPESLYILLTSDGGRRMLSNVDTVIVDEIHALVANKRGAHLALSLERLEALVGRDITRIGLSATQNPIEEVARFLVGARCVAGEPIPCRIVDVGHQREMDVMVELPGSPLETVMSHEVFDDIYQKLAALITAHQTTLVFVNTRKLAERVTRHLAEILGEEAVAAHHGSLARTHRLDAEHRLKSGELRAVVATASLELGIDVGDVDLVCQLGSPHSVATFLQRVGRSGHWHGGTPKGRLFPLSRDDLVECAALMRCVRRGELDRIRIPEGPIDILAQQIVASTAATAEWSESALLSRFRRAWPYRHVTERTFDEVLQVLSEGFATSRGRRGAYLHRDEIHHVIRPRRSARLTAITNGGAIPDNFDYEVRLEPEGLRVGTVNEDLAIESAAGDIFQLGNHSYQILGVQPGVVRVADAKGKPATLPFWLGEAPARADLLSISVNEIREGIEARHHDFETVTAWLEAETSIGDIAAKQLAEYLVSARIALGAMPTRTRVVLERFFDETGAMHLVLHAPFGSRINRAWGLSLRKRFCRSFNVELQAAATEDAIVLSLGPTHSFPLEDVFRFLRPENVRDVLVQAMLDAPMFQTRWRWNATRALALLRFRGGKKVPPQFQRMQADDLLALCFPDQVACLENVAGDREVPDHPLVRQTIEDCLHEAMDIEGLEALLGRMQAGELDLLARDLTEPSPLAQEILNAKPYAFLDDAPLEERRTQAVMSRRWLDPARASDLGALDQDAIDRVRTEAWPDPRGVEEMHDALLLHYCVTEDEAREGEWLPWLESLASTGRATRFETGSMMMWTAAERIPVLRAAWPAGGAHTPVTVPERYDEVWSPEEAAREITRGRLQASGPITRARLARALGLDDPLTEGALAALEAEGFVLRGTFTPGADDTEWCERGLLARIHRYTINRLRQEIEAVTAADYLRFLFRWQHATPDTRMEGSEGLAAVLEQLEGVEAGAAAWEADVFPVRMEGYDPSWLDQLCISGRVTWSRRSPPAGHASSPIRTSPIAFARRSEAATWRFRARSEEPASGDAGLVLDVLERCGASFFDDIIRNTGLLPSRTESALGELVSLGLVTADGFTGLRALLAPDPKPQRRHRRRAVAAYSMEAAGRWTVLPDAPEERDLESIAWTLLRRWGVVFRRVLEREGDLPPWYMLLRVYRRLEAQGLIRGGRFVGGFAGEQYALPEAVTTLRKSRRAPKVGELISISAADPLNLVGILTPGRRVAAIPRNRVLFRDGLPIAFREGSETRFLEDPATDRWVLTQALRRQPVPRAVQAYLGSRA